MAISIVSSFALLRDPRGDRGKRHLLSDIITIAILATVCGAEHWSEMEDFGQGKEAWLRTFLRLPHGVPSEDTFGAVFAALDPEAFDAAFRAWTQSVAGSIKGVVAIDGKTLRRSFDKAGKKAAVHMVSAWAAENGVVLGRVATAEKSNEITAIPALLKLLQIKGLIVTIDAMGCQREIAQQIIEKGGDYVIQVKGNQPNLLKDVQEAIEWGERREFKGLAVSQSEETEKGHGRIETRRATVLWNTTLLRDAGAWRGLACVARIESVRKVGEATSVERRYYISSVAPERGKEVARACRLHWGVENGLHWCLDMTFREDESRIRAENSAQNMSRLRRAALNLLKQEKTCKRGVQGKRFRAAIDEDYLLKVIRA
jgi:predicted transposase YbfD/YdcC